MTQKGCEEQREIQKGCNEQRESHRKAVRNKEIQKGCEEHSDRERRRGTKRYRKAVRNH